MAFKYALFAALCIAQGFAFTRVARSDENIRDPAEELPVDFEGIIEELSKIETSVTTDSSESDKNLNVILLCLGEQRDDYVQLGRNVSDNVRAASTEITKILGKVAEEYAEMLKPHLKNITDTLIEFPKEVHDFIQKGDFVSAMKVIMQARENVKSNGKLIGGKIKEMAEKVPGVADLAEKRAQEIRQQAKEGMEKINKAFKKCVEEGGPSKKTDEEA